MTSSVLSEQTDTETLVVYSPLQPLLLRSSPLPQQTSPFFSPSSRLCPLSFFLRDKESGSPGGQDSSWPRASAAVWPASFIMDQWLEPLFCQQLQMCDCYCNHMRKCCVKITVHLSLKYRITAVILQAVLAYQFKWFYQVCLIFYYSVTLTYCLLGCLCIYCGTFMTHHNTENSTEIYCFMYFVSIWWCLLYFLIKCRNSIRLNVMPHFYLDWSAATIDSFIK